MRKPAATGMESAGAPAPLKLPRRIAWSAHATGLFCDSYTEVFTLIVPLWAVHLGMTPLEIGVLVAARAFLPFFLAIHGGVLIDRFGTRRMMIAVSAACLIVPPLFPVMPWFGAMLLLQTAGGLAGTWAWVGAQAQAVQVSNADTAFVSRWAFFARLGAMSGPIALGIAWDLLGPEISFIIAGLWGGAFLITSLLIPETGPPVVTAEPRRFRASDLAPRLSDYVGAFALLAMPAVTLVVAASFIRACSANMQSSFYVVYLEEIQMPGSLIGTLVALTHAGAGIGTLTGGWIERLMKPQAALMLTVFLSVAFIAITPLLGGIVVLLAIGVIGRGFFQGVSQPIIFTYLSRAVGMAEQATSIGLRTTVNRLAVLVLPVLMGAVAELWGVGPSFLVMGGLLLALLGGIAVWLRRRKGATL